MMKVKRMARYIQGKMPNIGWGMSMVALAIGLVQACQPAPGGLTGLHKEVAMVIDSLYAATDTTLLKAMQTADDARLQTWFLNLRSQYKRMELAAEYFMPGTAKGINGAALPEVEVDENKWNEPMGLQVLEGYLFPEVQHDAWPDFYREARNLHAMLERARQIWDVTTPTEGQWMDALYYAWIRVATMGITGFDTPLCATGVLESRQVAAHMHSVLAALKPQQGQWKPLLDAAGRALQQANDFNHFDRAAFLRGPWQRMFAWLAQNKKAPAGSQAIIPGASQLFGNSFYRLEFYMPDSLAQQPAVAALGKQLFYDKRLSARGQFSCASCHQPDKFFTDQQALSENIHGNKLSRNTPTLWNAAIQTSYFWDMRVLNLEMQAKSVIDNALEMHGSLDAVVKLLNTDKLLKQQAAAAFGRPDSASISPAMVTAALAAYQRTLIDFNSPFDAYMTGESHTLNSEAIAGFNLFMGKAKCATCHFPPSFAGLVPPYFDKMESEVIGVPAADGKALDADLGRWNIHPVEAYKHAFKTPTVRLAAHTFPYMHNGALATLTDVVNFYDAGGGAGKGLPVPNQTLPADSLHLSAAEKQQLVAFMESLGKPKK